MKSLSLVLVVLALTACDEIADLVTPASCSGSSVQGSWKQGSKSLEFTRDCQVTANVNLIGCGQNNLTYVFTAANAGSLELTCPSSGTSSQCSFQISGTSPLKELTLTCGGSNDGTYEEFVGLAAKLRRQP